MTRSDTVTNRELYQSIAAMRSEMQEIRKELRDDFKLMMSDHCKWAENVVKDAYAYVDKMEKRLNSIETFRDNLVGKMSVIVAIVGVVVTTLINYIERVFASK